MKRRLLAGIAALALCCTALSGCTKERYTATWEYSHHTAPDEERYRTVLADPEKLEEGGSVFALKEAVADWSGLNFGGLSRKDDVWGYDVRSTDLSEEDLSGIERMEDLSFNSDTIWPEKLPAGFDPEEVLEFNKNPGLGIRALHEQGMTGAGVGIAILDQALLLEHEQYRDHLMYYERIHCAEDQAQMHGSAVASIAVGKDLGVAPGARLYYMAETAGHFDSSGTYEFDASILADCILRVLEINRHLPEGEKIRVISISKGYGKQDLGYEALTSAIEQAMEEHIFVLTTSTKEYYGFTLMGMDRDYLADPDDAHSYGPAGWLADNFYKNPSAYQDFILVPMGSRTYAGSTGTADYEISKQGGLSWAVPWFAGFYALCCQVKPDITPREFIETVRATGVTTQIEHEGRTYEFGKIVQPAAVVEALTK